MRSLIAILVVVVVVAAVATAAPQNAGRHATVAESAAPASTARKERQVVVTDPQNYESLLYINSASGLSRVSNSSGSHIFELILYPAKPSPPTPKNAVVVLGGGEAVGTLTLTQAQPPTGSVLIEGIISNLSPGLHGFHIHQLGNLKDGCISAAGHYNPYMRNHGSPKHIERHVGDLGNIVANQDGVAHVSIIDPLVTLVGPRSVIGRAIVVHAGEDDLGAGGHPSSLKTGNAGGRVACGVIGVA